LSGLNEGVKNRKGDNLSKNPDLDRPKLQPRNVLDSNDIEALKMSTYQNEISLGFDELSRRSYDFVWK